MRKCFENLKTCLETDGPISGLRSRPRTPTLTVVYFFENLSAESWGSVCETFSICLPWTGLWDEDLKSIECGSYLQPCLTFAVWFWASHFSSLDLSFLLCKMKTIIPILILTQQYIVEIKANSQKNATKAGGLGTLSKWCILYGPGDPNWWPLESCITTPIESDTYHNTRYYGLHVFGLILFISASQLWDF